MPRVAQRFAALRLLDGLPVSLVHAENTPEIRVISFRANAVPRAFRDASTGR